ncbi:hypothetical protein NKJ93_02115 [Mesorhizobium sp. M0028]|uniref:hypothetical protein n=1 Tax=Mesorhizobium sp. M0028 TaxID=2956849 RepID=UPI003336507E
MTTPTQDILDGITTDIELLRMAVEADDPKAELRIRLDDIRSAIGRCRATLTKSSPVEAVAVKGWTHVKHPPKVGGAYVVGGYYMSGSLRTFGRTFATVILTIDGPEWSHHDEKRSFIPIEYWYALPPHPEFAAPAPLSNPEAPAAPVVDLQQKLRDALLNAAEHGHISRNAAHDLYPYTDAVVRVATPPAPTSAVDGEEAERIASLEAFHREVWGWLIKRGLVDNGDDEWDGFTTVIEEHEAEIEAGAIRSTLSKTKAVPAPMGGAGEMVEVAYRWRVKGAETWVYDPTPDWVAAQMARADLDIEPLYAALAGNPSLQIVVSVASTSAEIALAEAYSAGYKAGRNAAPPVGDAAEAVAWLAEGAGWKRVFLSKEAAEKLANEGGRLVPLFANPLPKAPIEPGVQDALRQKIEELGSYAALARLVGISDEYVRQVALGIRPIRGKLLAYLGFELVKAYRRMPALAASHAEGERG